MAALDTFGVATDAHYTPSAIAAEMVQLVREGTIRNVADLAAGDGALLRAAEARFPEAAIAANDAHAPSARKLRGLNLGWEVGSANFLDTRSRSASSVTRPGRTYDLIVLNPPFSYRGSRGIAIPLSDDAVHCVSPAAAFVVLASRYVSAAGELLCVLPRSSLRAEKDAAAWADLFRRWKVTEERTYDRFAFPGQAALTTLIHMSRRKRGQQQPGESAVAAPLRVGDRIPVRIVRGCTPLHTTTEVASGRRYIHTTSLRRDGLAPTAVEASGGRETSGPAVLLPRVGAAVPWKVQLRFDPSPALLSDCVIALECQSDGDAQVVASRLLNAWTTTAEAWSGSCAPYITISRLESLLGRFNVASSEMMTRNFRIQSSHAA